MPIPTVTELNEGKEDLDDLESLVNGTGTVTTRLGGVKRSYSNLMARAVSGSISAYSSSSTYTEIDEWVEHSGVVYRPRPEALPISPTSPLTSSPDASKWVVVQIMAVSVYDVAGSPNITWGYEGNTIETGTNVRANVIAGGGYVGTINHIDGDETRYATISGGYDNYINGVDSTTDIDGAASTIAGGAHHEIKCTHATIGGGSYGLIEAGADYATIIGGTQNTINTGAEYSAILGGLNNTISAKWSGAWGRYCTVTGEGSFGMCQGQVGQTYTHNTDHAFGANFDYYLLTGGNVAIGNSYDKDNLPTARLDLENPGADTTPGNSQILRIGARFALRFHDDNVLSLDRVTGGVWSSLLTFNRATGAVSIAGTSTTRDITPDIDNSRGLGSASLRWGGISAVLPTYADDATAGGAGLTAGQFYKTAAGEVRVKL